MVVVAVIGLGQGSVQPRGMLSKSQMKSSRASKSNARYGGFTDEVLKDLAPCCAGHRLACKLLKVKKDGKNKGRKFYGCSFPKDQRCSHFVWAEDNPELVAIVLEQQREVQIEEAGLDESARVVNSALRSYADRLSSFTVEEIKAEIRACKRKRSLRHQSRDVKLWPVLRSSGCRKELVQTLMDEARRTLAQDQMESLEFGDMDNCALKSDAQDEMVVFSDSDSDGGDEESSDGPNLPTQHQQLPQPPPPQQLPPQQQQQQQHQQQQQPQPQLAVLPIDTGDSGSSSDEESSEEEEGSECSSSDESSPDASDHADTGGLDLTDTDTHSPHDARLTKLLRESFGFLGFRNGQRYDVCNIKTFMFVVKVAAVAVVDDDDAMQVGVRACTGRKSVACCHAYRSG